MGIIRRQGGLGDAGKEMGRKRVRRMAGPDGAMVYKYMYLLCRSVDKTRFLYVTTFEDVQLFRG